MFSDAGILYKPDRSARSTPFALRSCKHCMGLNFDPTLSRGGFCGRECELSFHLLWSCPHPLFSNEAGPFGEVPLSPKGQLKYLRGNLGDWYTASSHPNDPKLFG